MSRKFSKEEAQRIFSLAAEKQQAKEKHDVNQLSIEDLEEAGLAAGISPEFIRAAAGDILRPDRVSEHRKFFGLPVEFRESHVLPMEFNKENWNKSVDIFTHVYKKPGKSREIGTTKRWSSEQNDNQMPAHIIAEQEENGTRITIERKMWPMTMGLGIGSLVNLFIGLVFFAVWFGAPDAQAFIYPASILTGIGALMSAISAISLNVVSQKELERFSEVFSHLNDLSDTNELTNPEKEKIVTSNTSRISLDEFDGPENKEQLTESRKQQAASNKKRTAN